MARASQMRGAQCSCISCIGLRPALLPRLEEVELSSLLRNAHCCLAWKQFTLIINEVFQNLSVFPYLGIVNADF